MNDLPRLFLAYLCLTLAAISQAADTEAPQLPDWEVLEFEEKAFWATARSRLDVMADPENIERWKFSVSSSVVNNAEEVHVDFDPVSGSALTRSRLSKGKQQRTKSYRYETDYILRERRNPGTDSGVPPEDWPVAYSGEVSYPETRGETVVTSSYLLLLLAQQLQDKGPGNTREVLVHTDLNFFRVRLGSGKGIPIDVNYTVTDGNAVRGTRETMAVSMKVTPEGTPAEDNDFSFFGLEDQIIIFFDRDSGLPMQVRGVAPRIGNSEINLKSVTMRKQQ